MSLRRITLDERDGDGVIVDIDAATAAALARTVLVEARIEPSGSWRLLPRGRVGAVRVGTLQVEVRPTDRIGVSNLLFLLGYAADPGYRPEDVIGLEQHELLPALAESLARQVERALARGVLQGYRTIDASERVVRGRIRFGDQLVRRPGLLVPLEITFDEFTVDTSENRLLRSALRRMLAVPRVPESIRRRLLHADGKLAGVAVLTPGAASPRWQPARLNERYQPALRLAETVLGHVSAEAGEGELAVAAFVVSMWQVFEEFTTVALTEALARLGGRSVAQYDEVTLDVAEPGRRPIRLFVDLVHLDDVERPRLIFDAKYKYADGSGRYPNADHYQMLAYCTALRVDRAWLVYAQGGRGPVERRVRNSDVTIVEYPLDLKAAPAEIMRQIDELADAAVSRSNRAARQRDEGAAAWTSSWLRSAGSVPG